MAQSKRDDDAEDSQGILSSKNTAIGTAEILANRATTIPLILEEILRQRKEQDERLEYLRRIAGLFLSIFLPGSALAVFSVSKPIHTGGVVAASALVIIGLLATLAVLNTREWQSGPKVSELIDGPYRRGLDMHDFQYVLVLTHTDEFRANEGQIRNVQRWLMLAIICFVLSAATLGTGLIQVW